MEFPSIGIIYDRKKKSSEKSEGTVEIRVTFNRQQKYYSNEVKVLPAHWDPSLDVISHPNAIMFNSNRDSLEGSIKKYITEFSLNGVDYSFSGIASALDNSRLNESFPQFVEESLEKNPIPPKAPRKTTGNFSISWKTSVCSKNSPISRPKTSWNLTRVSRDANTPIHSPLLL